MNEGTNTVVIQNKANYTNVDFVEFYKADSVYYYPIERQQLGMQTVGERIEAEWGYPTDSGKTLTLSKSTVGTTKIFASGFRFVVNTD